MVLSVIVVIGLGISVLILQQIKTSRQMGQSVIAFYAAESGAERCLYDVRKVGANTCSYNEVSLDFNSDAKYTTTKSNGADRIDSVGWYQNVSRALELTW
ncbi:MAG: hypothetical protein ABH884_02505 [Candidatus Komeilibacteria bacterium]